MTSEHAQTLDVRERAQLSGVDQLSDRDLLALVLCTGARGRDVLSVSDELLTQAGSLRRLALFGTGRVSDFNGVGLAKAGRLSAAFELGRRACACRHSRVKAASLRSASAVYALMAPRVAHLDHEEMWVISLDGRSAPRGIRRVAQGGQHGLSISAREILRTALLDGARAFVLIHNHPSGDPTPSEEDLGMTRAVADAGEIVGVPLVDHVVIGATDYRSLLELGLLGS